ncbi:MAG TPA: DNA polymerase Y family protein [Steroidobacteraceae bacterium]|nr:DNA polymerase Y family protein [Steroidobacteraceae bacterium]
MHRSAPQPLKADGVPPTPQIAGGGRVSQLWYAVVFPELIDAAYSAAVLQRLCLHAQTFTSFVSIEPPNALLLEIKGSLKLFGSLERLHADIDACWRRLALQAYSAAAPSTLAALWLARSAAHTGNPADRPPVIDDLGALPGHLAEMPIACTAWDIARLETLRAMGVTRIGELLRLPRAGLARRLGSDTVQDLDMALARQFAPRRAFVPRERFRARCDFETEIENAAYLEKALEPLIGRCAQFLRERQAGIQALRLKLRHRAEPASCVHVGLASITSERRRLTDVLTEKLTQLELAAPVRGMELISGSLRPLSAGSLDVFAGLAGSRAGAGDRYDSLPQLVERLRARLGEDAVYGVASIPEHRPEAAWRRVHELPLPSASRADGKMIERGAGEGMPRPVWLLDAPQPLASVPLILEQGPERIESGWWDGKGVARDYYVARRTPDAHRSHGAKLWVFQERQSKRWYLHGMFA